MREEDLQLRKENQELREALKQAQEFLGVALAWIEELEKLKTPSAFVNANKKTSQEEEKKTRKSVRRSTIEPGLDQHRHRSSNIMW